MMFERLASGAESLRPMLAHVIEITIVKRLRGVRVTLPLKAARSVLRYMRRVSECRGRATETHIGSVFCMPVRIVAMCG